MEESMDQVRRALAYQDKVHARIQREFVDAEALSEEELRARIRGRELDEQEMKMALAIFSQQGATTTADMCKYVIEIRQGIDELNALGWWDRRKAKDTLAALQRQHDLLEVAWYSTALVFVIRQKNKG
jgi:hypothetical protein